MNSTVVRVTLCALFAPACYYASEPYRSCGAGARCPDGLICSPENLCVPGDGSMMGSNAAAACDASDPDLRLCLTFDGEPGEPLVRDLSGRQHQGDNHGVVAATGKFGDRAAMLDGASRIHFSEALDFTVTDLTIEMWIAPGASAGRLLDNNDEYFMSYSPTNLGCGIASGGGGSSQSFPVGQDWHHVACRYRRQANELCKFIDGEKKTCDVGGSGIPNTGTSGITIGAAYSAGNFSDYYIGRIDNVRLYARAMPDAELCMAAHGTGCATRSF